MSLGNGNPKHGDKGSNFNFEHRQLLTQGEIIASLRSLVAILGTQKDFEIILVRDTVTGIIYQQVHDYTTGVDVVVYKDVSGAVVVPPNPVEYIDPIGLPVVRTQTFQTILGASGPTTIAAGARGLSFYNAGPTDVTLDAGTLSPGIQVSFSAGGEDDTLSAMTYSTLATGILVITKVI